MADKPAEADEAQAYEANDAEANEADVADEATETDEADAIDEAADSMRPMMQRPTRLMWPISPPRLSSSVKAEAYEDCGR